MKFVVNILEYRPDETEVIESSHFYTTYEKAITFAREFNGVGFTNKVSLAPIEVKD